MVETPNDATIANADRPDRMPTRARWMIAAVVVIAFAVRMVIILGWLADQPLAGDANWYSASGAMISQGDWFLNPESAVRHQVPDADHPPVTSLFLAVAPVLMGVDGDLFGLPAYIFGQRVTLAVVGSAAAWVAALACRRLLWHTRWRRWSDLGAAAAGLGVAFQPNFVISDATLYSESVAALVIAWVILVATRVWDCPTTRRWLELGVAIGIATLVRPEQLALSLFLVVPLAMSRGRGVSGAIKPLALTAIAVVAALAPWIGPNLVRFNEPVLLSTNDGPTILGTYCPDAVGGDLDGQWAMQCLRFVDADGNGVDDWADFVNSDIALGRVEWEPNRELKGAKKPVLDASDISAAYSEYGLNYAKDHISDLPRVMVVRVGRQWGFMHVRQNINLDLFDSRPRTLSWSVWVLGWLAMPVTWWGIALLRREGRPWWPLAVHFVVVTVAAALFYGRARFRVPWDVSTAVSCGVVAAWLAERYGRRRSLSPSGE